jgi:hypothetical protein
VDFEEIILQQMRYEFVFSSVTEAAGQNFQSAPWLWDRWTYQELFVSGESLAQEVMDEPSLMLKTILLLLGG